MKRFLIPTLMLMVHLSSHPWSVFGNEPSAKTTQHLIENPKCNWKLEVELNHSNGVYQVGEELELSVVAPRDCYVHIININPNGELAVLWPLNEGASSFVKSKEKVSFPASDIQPKVNFRATQPVGKELIICFATTQPLNLKQEQDRKMFLDFMEGVEKVSPVGISRIKSFVSMVQQDDQGWTAKAIEVTTVAP